MNINNKYQWADSIRVTATVGVIFLHLSAPLLTSFSETSMVAWWTANIYDSAVRFCVPAFVMLSGALLLPKEYELKDFLGKKLVRIVLPFLFWTVVYLSRKIMLMKMQGKDLNFSDTFKWMLIQIRDGSTSYHLWYIYMIIGIYLFIPVIGKWVRNCSKKEIEYFLALWFISVMISQPALSDFSPDFDLTYFSGYIGYLVLGYYLSVKSFGPARKVTFITAFLIFISLTVTIIGTYFLSAANSAYASYFHGNFSPTVLLLSASIFLFFKSRTYTNSNMAKVRNFISKYSFGIYLAHVLVIKYIGMLRLNWELIHPALAIPLQTVVCLIFSSLIVFTINKIPYGKYVSG